MDNLGRAFLFVLDKSQEKKLHLLFELNAYVHQNDTELILVISIDAIEEQHCPFKHILSALICCLILIPFPLPPH